MRENCITVRQTIVTATKNQLLLILNNAKTSFLAGFVYKNCPSQR